MCYDRVQAYFTLYQFNFMDSFRSGQSNALVGDSLSLWSNGDLVWDYAIGGSTSPSNPSACPPVSLPPALVVGKYFCATGNNRTGGLFLSAYNGTFYPTPLFGPSMAIDVNVTLSCAPLEIRICLSDVAKDENIYIGDSSIRVGRNQNNSYTEHEIQQTPKSIGQLCVLYAIVSLLVQKPSTNLPRNTQ